MRNEDISSYTGGGELFQKSRRMWMGFSKFEGASPSGFRSTEGEQSPKLRPLSDEEKVTFSIIRSAERRPFGLKECVLVRYPCCYRVGPAGWATCGLVQDFANRAL